MVVNPNRPIPNFFAGQFAETVIREEDVHMQFARIGEFLQVQNVASAPQGSNICRSHSACFLCFISAVSRCLSDHFN